IRDLIVTGVQTCALPILVSTSCAVFHSSGFSLSSARTASASSAVRRLVFRRLTEAQSYAALSFVIRSAPAGILIDDTACWIGFSLAKVVARRSSRCASRSQKSLGLLPEAR